MIFKPAPCNEGRRGLVTTLTLLLVDLGLIGLIAVRPVDGWSFLALLILLVMLAYTAYAAWRTWCCWSLVYWIDRNAVTVAWGPLRPIIPLGRVQQITLGWSDPAPESGGLWLQVQQRLACGPELGRVRDLGGRRAISLATQPPARQLLLETDAGAFGLSPANPKRFVMALEEHYRLGPTRLVGLERKLPGLAQWAIWRDRSGLGLLVFGFAAGLMLLGMAMARYPRLLADASGTGSEPPAVLFLLPAFALAVWLLNGLWGLMVHERQPVAARLLWGGTLVAQVVALFALLALLA